MPVAEVLSVLGADENGLTDAQARRRLDQFGPNALVGAPAEAAWRIFVRQFKSIVIGLLIAATLLAWFTGDPLDSLAIATVLILRTMAHRWRTAAIGEAEVPYGPSEPAPPPEPPSAGRAA